MKNKIKYSNEPIEARVISDFLPNSALKEVLEEYKDGKTKSVSTADELEADFEEMRKEASK